MTDQVRGDFILGCSFWDNRALNEELVFAVQIRWGCALSLHSNYLQPNKQTTMLVATNTLTVIGDVN